MINVDKNEFFREVTVRISSSLNIEQALGELVGYLRQFMPIDHSGLFYLDDVRNEITALAGHGDLDELGLTTAPIPLDEEDLSLVQGIMADKGKPLVELNHRPQGVKKHLAEKYFPAMLEYSSLVLQLRVESDELGVLNLWAKGFDRFTEEQAELINLVKEPIAIAMSNARRYLDVVRLKDMLADDNKAMYRDMERITGNEVVGADFGLRPVMELLHQVAPMNSPVLLLGETGTGKEVIANAVHIASPRRDAPFVRVQCGAIPETLLDSELFGHEKGAFTGAISTKRGRFERAEGGTIFLDEIAELTPEAQVKLLRVLQSKEFERLGGAHTLSADVRVIAATHRDLEEMVRRGTFREDLWFRLNVFPIRIPPLRYRKDDIPSLVHHFVERKRREMNLMESPRLAPDSMERLLAYDWPGNVRELQNIIERSLILSGGKPLIIPDLCATSTKTPDAEPTQESVPLTLDEATARHIRDALSHCYGRIEGPGGAAELLNINPSTLRARLRKLGIPFGRNARY